MIHLITGYKGYEHIQSADQGRYNASFFGSGEYVLEYGNQCRAEYINNNTVRIHSGEILMQGRHISIEPNTYEDLTIETGSMGTHREDLIVMTYEKDAATGIERAYLEVIKGVEMTGSNQAIRIPDYGNILEGATKNQMLLYQVNIQGVTMQPNIVKSFETIPTYDSLAKRYEQEFIDSCNTHLNSLNILDSVDDIEANTESNQMAGALVVKGVINDLENHTHDNRYYTEIEIDAKLNAKQNTIIVEKKTGTKEVTIKEDEVATLSIGVSKSGYTPVAIVGFDTNSDNLIPISVYLDSSTAKMKVRCISEETEDELSSLSVIATGYYVNVMYKKN